MEKKITQLKEGDHVKGKFVVKFKKGLEKYKNGYRILLNITDETGKGIEYVYWGSDNEKEMEELYNSIKQDGGIQIEGDVRYFGGRMQISSNKLEVLPEGTVSMISPPKRDIEEMKEELKEYINSITNEDIRKVLEEIFKDEFMERFSVHPGAIEIHHARKGGLIEHTLEVARIVRLICEMYPEINRDIAIAGALLHDIGKVDEIAVTSRIKSEVKGQMLGHIVYGTLRLSQVMDQLGTPEDLKGKLLHILISHHGSLEYGSPKEPMTLEAFAVSHADSMSAHIMQIIDFIELNKDQTEDATMYNKRLGRNIYLRN